MFMQQMSVLTEKKEGLTLNPEGPHFMVCHVQIYMFDIKT